MTAATLAFMYGLKIAALALLKILVTFVLPVLVIVLTWAYARTSGRAA